ncbi:ABC transporter ATP-binding protein [Clostridium thailandense]|nr:ABC transporter ATP-binding protein [Clostridium thailandense]
MIKIFKRMSKINLTAAIVFLVLQVLCDLYLPNLTADIVNNGIMTGKISYIFSQGGIMILVSIAGLLSAEINTYVSSKLSYKLARGLRSDIFQKVQNFSNHEFDKIGTVSLITRNINDVTQVQNLIEMVLKFLTMAPIYLFGGIIMTYRLSPSLSKIFIIAIPIIIVIYFGVLYFSTPLFEKLQNKIDTLNLIFREGLTGIKVIHAFNKEKWEYDRYQKVNDDYKSISIKVNTLVGTLLPAITLIMSFVGIAIIWIGGHYAVHGGVKVGTILAVITYSTQILMSLTMLINVVSSIPRGQTSAKRINEILEMNSLTDDPKENGIFLKENSKISLEFKDVSFRFKGAKQNALENINLSIKQGQTLAIIGSTGSGKSTLINLISRFYDAVSGAVLVNGIDVRNIQKESLHKVVSFVPQKSTLFFGTLRDNMKLGNSNATDLEILEALSLSQAIEFVEKLDKDLDSNVEKNGGNFSGGQKQRLCIARALLKKADIYIFDDSLSALDFKTDFKIREAIRKQMTDKITVIVAQRISTVMHADQIAVLSEGKIVGLGSHEYLKKTNKVYQEILASQFEKEDLICEIKR